MSRRARRAPGPAALRGGLLGLAAALAGCGSSQSAVEATRACEPPVRLAALPAATAEASGIVADPRRPGLFWVHNDSGNDPVLFAVDTTGALRARAAIQGGTSRDIEDLALGPCGEGPCLWLGDLGDNQSRHADTRVHRLPLPPLPPADAAGVLDAAVRVEESYRIRYPDGAVDVESLAVDPARGELVLISKGREGRVWLFVAAVPGLAPEPPDAGDPATAPAPAGAPSGGETGEAGSAAGPSGAADPALPAPTERQGARGGVIDLEIRRVARLDLPAGGVSARLVTGADLSPDGRTLAVRTYTQLFLYDWEGSARLGDRPRPRGVASLRPAQEPQGEGVAFGDDPEALYLVSEALGSRPAQLSRIRCPVASR